MCAVCFLWCDFINFVIVGCWWKWSAFSDCRTRCEGGRSLGRERYPVIIQQPMLGGTPCPDFVLKNTSEERKCRDEACSGQFTLLYIQGHACTCTYSLTYFCMEKHVNTSTLSYLSVCLSVYTSVCPFVCSCLSVYLPDCLSVSLSVCLRVPIKLVLHPFHMQANHVRRGRMCVMEHAYQIWIRTVFQTPR